MSFGCRDDKKKLSESIDVIVVEFWLTKGTSLNGWSVEQVNISW